MENVQAGTYTFLDKETNKLVTLDLFTGEEVTDNLPTAFSCKIPYSVPIAQLIYTHIREGLTLNKISMLPAMPPISLIYRWATMYPDFAENLKQARLDRAHTFADKIVELNEDILSRSSTIGKTEVVALKVAGDNYKWLAERGNQKEYGNKTQLSGDANNPLMFTVVDTGIRRTFPVEAIPVPFPNDNSDAIPAESTIVTTEEDIAEDSSDGV